MSNKKKSLTARTQFYIFLESLVPPIMLDLALDFIVTVKYLLKFALFKTKKINLKKPASKNAFLFATGPSIRDFDFNLAEDCDCFSVSNFYLHDFGKTNHIKGHFFAPFHKPLIRSEYIQWLQDSDKELSKDTVIYLGDSTKKLVEENNIFEKREIVYLSLEKGLVFGEISDSRPILKPYSGPLMILPILIMMGYKKIFLCGCDHTVLRDFKGSVTNFYESSEELRSNATNNGRWDSGIMHHLDNMKKIILQYRRYKLLAKRRSIEIFNLSNDSWLDEFPFITKE